MRLRLADVPLGFGAMLIGVACFGQGKFELYGLSPCSNEVRQINHFSLRFANDTLQSGDSGVLLLKDSGIYVLVYALDLVDETQLGKVYSIYSPGIYYTKTSHDPMVL